MAQARHKRQPVSSVLPFLLKATADLPPEPIVGYLRKSSESEDKQVRSTAQQRAKITEKFGPMSLDLWFEDNGVSGRSFDRPEFQRMIAFCRANKQPLSRPGRVAIYDVSRFGRIVTSDNKPDVDAMEWQRLQLKQLGWHLAWVEGPNSENELANHFVRIINSQIAGQETSTLSIKVTNGKADAALAGWWPGGPAPFGTSRYNRATRRVLSEHGLHPDTGERINGEYGHQRSVTLVRNDTTASVLEELMKGYVNGASVDSLCQKGDKLAPKMGKQWTHSFFIDAITNPALIGEMHHNLKGGLRVVKMNWEPIIDPNFWHSVKAEYERRKVRQKSNARREYALDCLYCAECGAPYYGDTSFLNSGGKMTEAKRIQFTYYRHYMGRTQLGPVIYDRLKKAGCKGKRIPASLIENAVRNLLVSQRISSEYAKHLKALHADMMDAVENGHEEVQRAEQAVLNLKRKQQNLLDLAADQTDKDTATDLMRRYNELKPKIQEAEYEVERKQLAAGATKEMWGALEGCLNETKDILEAWDTMGLDAKSAVVRWWVLNIDVQLPKIAPKFNCPVVLQVYLRTLPNIPQTIMLETAPHPAQGRSTLGDAKEKVALIGKRDEALETSGLIPQYIEKFEVVVVTPKHSTVVSRGAQAHLRAVAKGNISEAEKAASAAAKREKDRIRAKRLWDTDSAYRGRSKARGRARRLGHVTPRGASSRRRSD